MLKKLHHKDINFSKPPKLDFLKRLTNQTGIMQHSKYGVPERYHGYSLDDNARALIVAVLLYNRYKKSEYLNLAFTYLSFLVYAKRADGFFNNFQTFDHNFLPVISEDGFGECIWALGVTIRLSLNSDLKLASLHLFDEVKNNITKLISPRAKAYSIIGLYHIFQADSKNKWAVETMQKLVDDLTVLYEKNTEKNWRWFEKYLTYANHIIPTSLFLASQTLKNKKILAIAIESQSWLYKQTHTKDEIPSPVGSNGWFPKGGRRAIFDQQPVEPAYAVIANLAAFRTTKKHIYLTRAKEWFNWFFGNNIKKTAVYNKETGSSFDGVTEKGVNLNQGAESTICFLLAYLDLADSLAVKRLQIKKLLA